MPDSHVVISLGNSVLGLFGGASVVLVTVCGFISKLVADQSIAKHKSNLDEHLENRKSELNTALERVKTSLTQETEGYKLKLRKAEILFERELNAAAEFSDIFRNIYPTYSRPDMDWDDACNDVASKFSGIEQMVQDYLTKHAPVLTDKIRDNIGSCIALASENKFGSYEMPEDQASAAERVAAGKLLDGMKNVQAELFALVKNETR
jgi:hypothetical protein